LREGADVQAVAGRQRDRNGVRAIRTFERAIQGFSARLDRRQRAALLDDPNVVAVVPDEVIELQAQTTPNGITRVGGKKSTSAAIDGVDQRVNADVAIVDTGVARHDDLNVVGGYNCSTSTRSAWQDGNGHGTHVAGTVAALDNSYGVVGIAPGARIWAVKILNDDGYGLLSWYVCGLDWIARQTDPNDASRPLIESVNMSVAKWGADDRACGTVSDDVLHAAICRVVGKGITVVAAAANDSGSATKRVPAAYNEVITVSALADTDGKAGGLGGNGCWSWGTYDKDDTFADFSNYGFDVDLMASGKCIWSTLPGDRYGYSSGTSMAAPAVAGAVALYKASRPTATPAQVKEALQYLGNLSWKTATDPDSTHEKLLDVSRLGKLGSFTVGFTAADPLGETGGTVTIPVSVDRSTTHFERIRLSLSGVPKGWTASLGHSSLMGWDAESTTLRVSVPAGTGRGTYPITVRAESVGRTVETDVTVTIDNDAPKARVGNLYPLKGSDVGLAGTAPRSVDLRFTWFAATDASSSIAGYEVQHQVDGGDWGPSMDFGPSARNVVLVDQPLGVTHVVRLRARDAVGNWSPWVEHRPLRFGHLSDRSPSLAYTGTWKPATVFGPTDKVRTTTSRSGAAVALAFSGKSVSVVMPRSAVRGKVSIYLDGVFAATVDTRSSVTQTRRVVFTKTWSTVASHTIRIVAAGTPGRPTVSLDGIIVGR
jgi:subtilisin